jgi:hypothetical protein
MAREDVGARRRPRGPLAGVAPRAPWWDERRDRGVDRGARLPQPRDDNGDTVSDEDDSGWLDPELARSAALVQAEPGGVTAATPEPGVFRKRRIYPFGVSRVRLEQAIREMGLPAVISRSEQDADALLVLKNMYRKQPDRIDAAQQAGVPVYMLRSAGLDRIREALLDLFGPDLARARATIRPPEA